MKNGEETGRALYIIVDIGPYAHHSREAQNDKDKTRRGNSTHNDPREVVTEKHGTQVTKETFLFAHFPLSEMSTKRLDVCLRKNDFPLLPMSYSASENLRLGR